MTREYPSQQSWCHLIEIAAGVSSGIVCWALHHCHRDAKVPAPRHAATHSIIKT